MNIGRRPDDLSAQVRGIVWVICNEHTVNRIVQRQIVERVSQQPDTPVARVADAERRSKRHLAFNREVPLLRVRHFQIPDRSTSSCDARFVVQE